MPTAECFLYVNSSCWSGVRDKQKPERLIFYFVFRETHVDCLCNLRNCKYCKCDSSRANETSRSTSMQPVYLRSRESDEDGWWISRQRVKLLLYSFPCTRVFCRQKKKKQMFASGFRVLFLSSCCRRCFTDFTVGLEDKSETILITGSLFILLLWLIVPATTCQFSVVVFLCLWSVRENNL